MNSYLSREEKASFVQLEVLAIMQSGLIEQYGKLKNSDAGFLKSLRTSHTWLRKAIDRRKSFLDEDAKIDFIKQVSRLQLLFVPSDMAKKELAALKELQDTIIMPKSDLNDLYCELIEYACKSCVKSNYTECILRGVLSKYGIYPVNPDAKESCQYSCIDADPTGLPQPSTPSEIVEDEQNEQQADDILPQEQDSVAPEDSEGSEPELVPYIGHGAPEPKSTNVPVEVYLSSGAQLALEVPLHMAEQLLAGMRALPKHNRPVCACHVDKELVAIDTQEVAVFRARGIGECELEQLQRATLNGNMNVLPHRSLPAGNRNGLPSRNAPAGNMNALPIKTMMYQVECKCGAEYVCRLASDRYKARCQKCHEAVYRDKEVKVPLNDGAEATLMTNRYFVPIAEQSDHQEAAPEMKKCDAVSYQDPCQIFE